MQLALAYRSSMVLFAASELDVFTHIADGQRMTAAELAAACGAAAGAAAAAARGVRAEGLLNATAIVFATRRSTDAFLVRRPPDLRRTSA